MPMPIRPNLSLVPIFAEDDDSYFEEVSEYSKLTPTGAMALGERVRQIAANEDILEMTARSWKPYPGAESVVLPSFDPPQASLSDVIASRRSVSTLGRDFQGGPISLEQLSGTLALAYGPTTSVRRGDGSEIQKMRATASAGGLYPAELYVIAFDVTDLDEGIYHYHPIAGTLEVIRRGDFREQFINAATYRGLAETCSVCIVLTAIFRRTTMKYRNRGMRFALLDVGGLCTSLYLSGTAMGMETCALGGFYDELVCTMIEAHPVDEPVQLCFLLGPMPQDGDEHAK